MGKHVDLTGHVDGLPRGYVKFRARPAHKAQPTSLTAQIDRELSYGADLGPGDVESTWTPGEVPPDVDYDSTGTPYNPFYGTAPAWHDVWAGDPDTDKAWARERDELNEALLDEGVPEWDGWF